MAHPNELQKLKHVVDCRELIKHFGIPFNGQNISCLNSSHPDKNPSMAVYKDNAHCFGCGLHLDAFGIVQTIQNVSFKESIDILASLNQFSFENKDAYKQPQHTSFTKSKTYVQKDNPQNHKDFLFAKPPQKKKFSDPCDRSIKESLWKIIKCIDPTKEALEWFSRRKISPRAAWQLGCRDPQPVIKEIASVIEKSTTEQLRSNHLINAQGDVWSPLLHALKENRSNAGILIPLFDEKGLIHSFRWRFYNPIQTDKALIKVSGQPACPLIPLGMHLGQNMAEKDTLFICEGEPDWLSIHSVLNEKNIKNKTAIGLCVLSNTWQDDWTSYISNFKNVFVCLHDTEKAVNVTEKIAISLITNDKRGLEYWKYHFFRKLFNEKKDANDFLIEGSLQNNLPF